MRATRIFIFLTGLLSSLSAPAATLMLSVNAGDNQRATVNSSVPIAPSVFVSSAPGVGAGPGVTVTFTVVSGSGAITGGTATTDANSIATLGSWTLGTYSGSNTLNVTSGASAALIFTATAVPDAPAMAFIVSGGNQSTQAGANATVAVCTRIKDQFGNLIPGAPVIYAVASGGGSITGANAPTDAVGIATLRSWTLGALPGANSLTATCGSAPMLTFNATGTPPPTPVVPVPVVLAFSSSPSALPNPAMAGQPVAFSATAASSAPVTYVWSYGDGSSDTGANATHTFSPAKTYAVTLVATSVSTVTDTTIVGGVTVVTTHTQTATGSATLALAVNPATGGPALLPGEFDSDGDGFSDAVESAAGSDPFDAKSIPGGGAALTQSTASNIRLKISAKKKSLSLTGSLHVPQDFTFKNQIAVADISGLIQKFALANKPSAKTGSDTFKLSLKIKNGRVLEQDAKFSLQLNNVPETLTPNSPLLFVIGGTIFTMP